MPVALTLSRHCNTLASDIILPTNLSVETLLLTQHRCVWSRPEGRNEILLRVTVLDVLRDTEQSTEQKTRQKTAKS